MPAGRDYRRRLRCRVRRLRNVAVLLVAGRPTAGERTLAVSAQSRAQPAIAARTAARADRSVGRRGASNFSKALAEKEKVLNSYGPSEEKGFVHVPIQEAIKATAGKLPVRKQPPGGANDNGLMDAGQSNSGRMFKGESK